MNELETATPKFWEDLGYEFPRQLPNGQWIGVFRFIFTYGLVVGLDRLGYQKRYCYHVYNDALVAVANWDGEGDPPGNWIVEKPSGRAGPGNSSELHKKRIESTKILSK